MFTRKFLAISIGIAITLGVGAPTSFAKKVSASEATRIADTTGSTADKNATESGDETDDDYQEVASVIGNSDKLVKDGKFEAAIEVLRNGIKEHGQNPHLHDRLSKVFYMDGSVDDAISELLMAISIDPNVFDYYSDVAWLYSISGNYREAVNYSKQAVSRDPDRAYPYVVMGFSLGCLGKKQQATEMLKKAIELDPQNSTAHLYLADVVANSGDYEKALPLYQKSLKLDNKIASAFVGLGDCFQKLGHQKEALVAFKHAVDLAPHDATARGHYGFALSQSGDQMGAMRQGMTANSIRLGQYWGKFMGMFVAVWAGIFLVFGTLFGAMFMGSRFNPVAGETVLQQFMMVFYKERPGRFVITDKRFVFVPEIVSRWFGATRVSIQRDQVIAVKTDATATGGTVTVEVTSESSLVFRVPALIFNPMSAAVLANTLAEEVEVEEPVKQPEPVATTRIPEKEEQSDTAQFEKYAVIAASFDFRDGKSESPTLKLSAIEEQEISSKAFPGAPKVGESGKQKRVELPAPKVERRADTKKDNKPALRPLPRLDSKPAEAKPSTESTEAAKATPDESVNSPKAAADAPTESNQTDDKKTS